MSTDCVTTAATATAAATAASTATAVSRFRRRLGGKFVQHSSDGRDFQVRDGPVIYADHDCSRPGA